MSIARTERQRWGGDDVALAVLAYPFAVIAVALRHAPASPRPWQASIHVAEGIIPATATFDFAGARWRSEHYEAPRPPLDALVARLALLGLPPYDPGGLIAALLREEE